MAQATEVQKKMKMIPINRQTVMVETPFVMGQS
jgi:hypothetical protein